jgi:hypothetical protein
MRRFLGRGNALYPAQPTVIARRPRADVAIQEPKGAPRSPDCVAIARPEVRASFDAMTLATMILLIP